MLAPRVSWVWRRLRLRRSTSYATATSFVFESPAAAQCHFLNSEGCSIHPAKPTQCRLYPFWPELVENRKAWNAEKRDCPGVGKGQLVQIGTACETAGEMKRAYPSLYA